MYKPSKEDEELLEKMRKYSQEIDWRDGDPSLRMPKNKFMPPDVVLYEYKDSSETEEENKSNS